MYSTSGGSVHLILPFILYFILLNRLPGFFEYLLIIAVDYLLDHYNNVASRFLSIDLIPIYCTPTIGI